MNVQVAHDYLIYPVLSVKAHKSSTPEVQDAITVPNVNQCGRIAGRKEFAAVVTAYESFAKKL